MWLLLHRKCLYQAPKRTFLLLFCFHESNPFELLKEIWIRTKVTGVKNTI